MSNKQSPQEPKKGIPGGFFLLLIAGVVAILMMQNLGEDHKNRVAFSHQLEHLTNLDLLERGENRKVALNDNLVTFSGRFKGNASVDGETRFRYLELLSEEHNLVTERSDLQGAIQGSRKAVQEAADLFLRLSGLPIPKEGYRVVDPVYNTASEENDIVIRHLTDKPVTSYADLKQWQNQMPKDSETVLAFGRDLLNLVEGFRSQALGIGDDAMKQQLKRLEQVVRQAFDLSIAEQLSVYAQAMGDMQGIIASLNAEHDNVRLEMLRSVRTYKGQLVRMGTLNDLLDRNQVQLDKARQAVQNVTWYFNNQELSTRALEKQDFEAYSHWFALAKQEWDDFPANQNAVFKAPDQPRNLVLEKTFKSEEPPSSD